MYYCGGPNQEQAGTEPIYKVSYNCMLQSSTALSVIRRLGRRFTDFDDSSVLEQKSASESELDVRIGPAPKNR
jgi:hypothetical protein